MNSKKTILGTMLGLAILWSTIFLLKLASAKADDNYYSDDALLSDNVQLEKNSKKQKLSIDNDLKNLETIYDFKDLKKGRTAKNKKYAKRAK